MGLFNLIPLIVIVPFLGTIINAFFGRKLMQDERSIAPGVLASFISGTAFLIAVLMFIALTRNPYGVEVPFLSWFSIAVGERVLEVPWTFKVDTLSSVMMLVVTGVGTLIHIYAIGYMDYDVDVKAHEWGISPEEAVQLKRVRFSRFFTYLNLFLGSMLILVTGNNFLMLFVGWELVGLCSFLLIGFWYDDPHVGISNAKAARKAFVVNRVGDFGMLMAIFLIFWSFGSLKFDEVFARAECMTEASQAECLTLMPEPVQHEGGEEHEGEDDHGGLKTVLVSASVAPLIEGGGEGGHYTTPINIGIATLSLSAVVTMITIFLLLGASGKSAQIPLFVWLPDAMAGPTPVSALIHAATMVTAGVYMISRSNVLFHMAPFSANLVAYVGGATALVAATIAVAQFDIKRVLAFSTISQLGFMVAAVGVGGYIAGVFHLATHAFFKALLFKGSGSVIQGMERGMVGDLKGHHGHDDHDHHGDEHDGHHDHVDPQDMRNMGGMLKQMPVTAWTYIIGALALGGIFPLAGFWSKDEILLDTSHELPIVYIMLSIAAGFTAFYMGRQVFMVFFGKPRTSASEHATESPATMTVPLIILAILATFGGLMNLPFEGFHNLAHWLEHSIVHAHAGGFDIKVAGISTGLALAAIAISWLIYGRKTMESADEVDPLQKALGPVFTFLQNKWYWDDVYATLFVKPYTWLGDFLAITIDWDFWHDYVHDKIIAQFYQAWAQLLGHSVDKDIVDGAVNGVAQLIGVSSQGMRRSQTGYVRNYALVIGIGVFLILVFLAVRLLI